MKKKVSHLTALLLTLGAVLCFAAGAAAADTLQTITAYLDPGITITLDGEAQTLTDAKGARVYPISYNGSTYLPVRAVAGLAGLEVNWDQATKTVQLGKMTGVDLIDTYKAYDIVECQQYQTADKQTKDISGKSYSHWIHARGAYRGVENSRASFNLEGKYSTLTFWYYANKDVTLQVLGENDYVLAEIPVTGGQVAQEITVNLLNTKQLTFHHDGTLWNGEDIYIFDAKLS